MEIWHYITQNTLLTGLLSAVLAHFLGQLLQEFLLRPLKEFYGIKGQIQAGLIFYSNVFNSPNAHSNEKLTSMEEAVRRIATELTAIYSQIPLSKQLSYLLILPKQRDIIKAASRLIALSTTRGGEFAKEEIEQNTRWIQEVRTLLSITDIHTS